MSVAVNLLQRELDDQKEKLVAIRSERKDTIEAGQRAQREVDAQTSHVVEIQNAINKLKRAEHTYPVAA